MDTIVPQSYAAKVNSKYLSNESVFVDAKDRLNQTIADLPGQSQNTMWGRIKKIAQHFSTIFPDNKKF